MIKINPKANIKVYDNVLKNYEQHSMFDFCLNSFFTIKGWQDTATSNESYLHSNWTLEDLQKSEFLQYFNITKILEESDLNVDNFKECVMNVDTLSDSHWMHTHYENVLLYYINLDWQDGWGGETLFYDADGKEIIYGSRYTPNRVIVFDGNIPHTIKHQNRIADKYRMSLSIFFNK